MRIFWKKKTKKSPRIGGSAPACCYFRLLVQLCRVYF